MLRLVRFVLVVSVLAFLFTLVGEWALRVEAADRLEDRIQGAAALPARPEVDLGSGFLLYQALRGRYDSVTVHAPVVSRDSLVLEDVVVDASGVDLPLVELTGSEPVPVDAAVVTGFVPFDSFSAHLPGGARASGAGNRVRVDLVVPVLGVDVPIAASARPVVDGRLVRFSELSLVLDGVTFPPDVVAELEVRLAELLVVELPEFPAGLELVELVPARDGLRFRLTGEDLLLSRSGPV